MTSLQVAISTTFSTSTGLSRKEDLRAAESTQRCCNGFALVGKIHFLSGGLQGDA